MKTIPILFHYQRARVFGWVVLLCIIGYIALNIPPAVH